MDDENVDTVHIMLQSLSINDKILPGIFKSSALELTCNERYIAAKDLFERVPCIFLEKFHKHITYENAVDCFSNSMMEDQVIMFYINKIKNRGNVNITRNRRKKKIELLSKAGDYFSFESMKNREPILYDKYIRQYNTSTEEDVLLERNFDTFSGFLMRNMLNIEDSRVRISEEEKIDAHMESINSYNDGLSDEEEVDENGLPNMALCDLEVSEKDIMREEFFEIMQKKFLNGEDDFNYSDIDNDSTLDDLDELSRKREELYFNEEEDSEELSKKQDDELSDDSFIGPNDKEKLAKYLNKF